jgi:hypothetical protein
MCHSEADGIRVGMAAVDSSSFGASRLLLEQKALTCQISSLYHGNGSLTKLRFVARSHELTKVERGERDEHKEQKRTR